MTSIPDAAYGTNLKTALTIPAMGMRYLQQAKTAMKQRVRAWWWQKVVKTLLETKEMWCPGLSRYLINIARKSTSAVCVAKLWKPAARCSDTWSCSTFQRTAIQPAPLARLYSQTSSPWPCTYVITLTVQGLQDIKNKNCLRSTLILIFNFKIQILLRKLGSSGNKRLPHFV